MKASSIFLNGWIVIILSGLETIQSSIFEDHSGDYEQYVVALIRPADFENSDQYLQIYITSKADTLLEIDLPATYLYRVARLTERNDWSWSETIHISSDLKQSAYSKGFHITADHPINIVVVLDNRADLSLVPYLIFPLPKQNPNEYIISDYPPRKYQTESSFLVATGEYMTEVDVFEPGSIHVPRSHSSVEKYSNYQYGVYYPKDIIGFRVLCSRPAAVYAKQQHRPRWEDTYYDMSNEKSVTFFQVPPLGRLGKRYVVGAPPTGTGDVSYVVIVASRQPNVSVTILLPSNGRGFQVDDSSPCQCQYDSTGLCQVNCTSYDGYETAKPYVEVKFLSWSPDVAAVVECDEACLVLVTTPSHGAHNSPTVSQSVMLVAPPGVIPGGVHFFVPPVYDELHARLMAVRVAVPTADVGGLLLDGLPITDLRPLLRYRTAAVSEWTVITIELAAGNHRVVHKADRRVPISVHVRGAMLHGRRQSTFGFPAAFPEPVEPSGDSIIYDTGKKPSQNPSEATNEDNSLTVAVFIFLLAECAAIVAIIVIIMKNNAMLRVIMGRNRGRRAKQGHHPRPTQNSRDERKPYTLLPKSNESFETYYKKQGIVPEGEWDLFLDALKKPLPATFRITGFKNQSQELLKLIKGEYFDKLVNVKVEGRDIEPPKYLPWYPGELAWQLDMDRKFIRQCETLKKLHNFLIEETESGNISRQEAVSMIPPLVLDVKSHHKVLDMCAAPGSKTAQIIEMLHACDSPVPEGCVIGNDNDNKRCYLMTHQVKRLESPSFIIINQDATCMPNFKLPNKEGHLKPLKFDRILADVPCSGDGTLRKNVDAWGKWNAHTAMHLHNLQSRILSRGMEMLAIGGRIVYSTCSMNPVEDEAVISNLLRKSKGSVRLLDVGSMLPGLKGLSGLSTWKVIARDMKEYSSPEELPESLKTTIRPSVFPPNEVEVQAFSLHKCLRILPHHQNTGGFFIAVMEKTEEVPWVTQPKKLKVSTDSQQNADGVSTQPEVNDQMEIPQTNEVESKQETDEQDGTAKNLESVKAESESRDKRKNQYDADSPPQKRQKRFGYKEDPFIFINADDPIWPPIRDFFKLKDFPVDQLLVRCTEGKKRNLYFASAIVKSLLIHNIDRFKFINLGLKILSRSDSPHVPCPFRTVQEGVGVLYPHVTDRTVSITRDDIVTLLSTEMPYLARFSKELQDSLQGLGQGSIIFVYDPDKEDRPDSPKCRMVLCGWLGRTSCRSFIPLNERGHYLRLCGVELVTKEKKQKKDSPPEAQNTEQTEGVDSIVPDAEDTDVSKGELEEESNKDEDELIVNNEQAQVEDIKQTEIEQQKAKIVIYNEN